MAYTVTKLAKVSGVSVRTLHWYDEIELLKPAYYGSNGYRYYEEEQLLMLQQILFFRELGFELKEIQKVLNRSDFDKVSALNSHKQVLQKSIEKTKKLIKTIDKTIKHLMGDKKMRNEEIFDGFTISLVKKSKGESYSTAEEIVGKSVRNPTKNVDDVQARGQEFYENATKTADAIYRELVHCIEVGLIPNSSEVQSIIKKHHAFTNQIQDATQEVYKAMAQLYKEHPEFRKQLDPFHLKLADFISEGMIIFADRELN